MMNVHPAGAVAEADFAKLRAYAEQAGRDPWLIPLSQVALDVVCRRR